MKYIITDTYHKGIQEAQRLRLAVKEFLVVTPTTWDSVLRGRTFDWNDLHYMTFDPKIFPGEFYELIKVCTHKT